MNLDRARPCTRSSARGEGTKADRHADEVPGASLYCTHWVTYSHYYMAVRTFEASHAGRRVCDAVASVRCERAANPLFRDATPFISY